MKFNLISYNKNNNRMKIKKKREKLIFFKYVSICIKNKKKTQA